MPSENPSRGVCQFCGKTMTRGGITKHFSSCPEYKKIIEIVNKKSGKAQEIYHLQVRDAWQKEFWLHLEMKSLSKLLDLDNYLRRIWLECCGHLSQFSIGGWKGDEIPMETAVSRLFQKGAEFTHIYDFGTSSETLVRVIGQRTGKALSKNPVFLMSRNELPDAGCIECDQPASWLCMECLYEHDEAGFLCDNHADGHPHKEYGEPSPLVNSPRLGMCGYQGPAEAPY
jgi:hypothetical protein